MTKTQTNRWVALPVLLAGAFIVVLDFFIVNVALPSIADELGAGEGALEWVVAGYGLTFAAFLITAGRLGDDLGRRGRRPRPPARLRRRPRRLHPRLAGLRPRAQPGRARRRPAHAGRRRR